MKFKQDGLYLVLWRDHFSTEGFFDRGDINIVEDLKLDSVGFFVEEDENYIHLARTKGIEQYADIMSIAKALVLEIEELK